MSRRCSDGRHAFTDGACTRKGCTATTTGDLFGAPLDASAGALFEAGEVEAAERGAPPPLAAMASLEGQPCTDCDGKGWEVFNEEPERGDLGDVEKCDNCPAFETDEDAAAEAQRRGYAIHFGRRCFVVRDPLGRVRTAPFPPERGPEDDA